MKKSLLLGAALCMAAGAMAQIAPGEYYVKNVETGMFLNEGFSWGTLAVVKDYPCAFEVTATSDAGYVFKSRYGYFKPENGEYYMDGGAEVTTYLEKNGDYYYMKTGGQYMTLNEEKDYLTDGWLQSLNMCETLLWTLKQTGEPDGNKSTWEVLSRAEMVAALATATPENPVQASFYLKAGQIEVNANNNISSWPYVKNNEPSEIVLPDGGWFGHSDWSNKTTYAWCENDAAPADCIDVVSQEVEGMVPGFYKVSYRAVNQSNGGETPLVIKFNDTEAAPTDWAESDLWYASAQDTMAHNVETAEFEVKADGKLSLRMEKTSKAGMQNRFAFKSFALYYIGTSSTGVANIGADENAPVEYYNLQGMRVANPEKGIFIKRQGNKATKVVL